MTADRDDRLAAVLDDLARQQRAGRPPDLDATAHQHPDLADDLRQLWAAAQLADALARPAGGVTGDRLTTAEGTSPPPAEGPALPRTFGDYVLLRELGRGGMGLVYAARQQS